MLTQWPNKTKCFLMSYNQFIYLVWTITLLKENKLADPHIILLKYSLIGLKFFNVKNKKVKT